MARATDRELASLARRLAGRLVLELARSGPAKGRGIGKLVPGRFEPGLDLDIDRSLDALVQYRLDGVALWALGFDGDAVWAAILPKGMDSMGSSTYSPGWAFSSRSRASSNRSSQSGVSSSLESSANTIQRRKVSY